MKETDLQIGIQMSTLSVTERVGGKSVEIQIT